MNYARRTNKTFSTHKSVVKQKSMSPEVASRRMFIATHSFSVDVNPSTKEASVIIESKHAE